MQKIKLKKTYKINAKAAEISKLLAKILKDLNKIANLETELLFDFELALREMLANAIEHGCTLASFPNKEQKKLQVVIKVKLTDSELKITVKDPGPGFNWLKQDLKIMPQFQARGRGLKIIYKLSNKLKFNQAGNQITASFYL